LIVGDAFARPLLDELDAATYDLQSLTVLLSGGAPLSAGLKAARALELARMVVAVELLCACQAIDLLAPLRTSAPLAHAHDFIRTRVPVVEADRSTSSDLGIITELIATGDVERACTVKVN